MRVIQHGRRANLEEVQDGHGGQAWFVRCHSTADRFFNKSFGDLSEAVAHWKAVEAGTAEESM